MPFLGRRRILRSHEDLFAHERWRSWMMLVAAMLQKTAVAAHNSALAGRACFETFCVGFPREVCHDQTPDAACRRVLLLPSRLRPGGVAGADRDADRPFRR